MCLDQKIHDIFFGFVETQVTFAVTFIGQSIKLSNESTSATSEREKNKKHTINITGNDRHERQKQSSS